MDHFDVVIVGAGLSGIGAACHLRQKCPSKSFVLLDRREAIGGTWDIFRYPGVRSDSDMHTLGYAFKPWREAKAIADGPSIRNYVRETAREHDVLPHIRFHHLVESASWDSQQCRWTVTAKRTLHGDRAGFTCNFLYLCGRLLQLRGWPQTGVRRHRPIPGHGRPSAGVARGPGLRRQTRRRDR